MKKIDRYLMILFAIISFPNLSYSQTTIIQEEKDNNYKIQKRQLNTNTSLPSEEGEYLLQSDGSTIFVSTKELLAWCKERNVAVYSIDDYQKMTAIEKSEVDNLNDKIIYSSDKIRSADIYAYKATKN